MVARSILLLLFASGVLLVLMVVFGGFYIGIMYDGQWNNESRVEAMYYSAQTVTAVGYGNWVPESKSSDPEKRGYDARLRERIMDVKAMSFWFMLATAPVFSLIIGIAAGLIVEAMK